MSNESDINLEKHFDVLRELSNIGSGNAATALASLMDSKVNLGIPNVCFIEFPQIADQLGGAEKIYASDLVNLGGDINGMMMFMMDIKAASTLITAVMKKERDPEDMNFDEMEMSFIKEIGNILSSSYLSSLATMTNLKIVPSIPYVAVDMAGAILSVPAIEFGKIGDQALFIESCLSGEKPADVITGYFILVPELESFDIILKALGVL